jgi:hypothetical protein
VTLETCRHRIGGGIVSGVQTRWLPILACFIACGGGSRPSVTAVATQRKVEAPPKPTRPPNTLYRDEVDTAKRMGLGHLFQLIDLEPKGELDGRGRMTDFKGFQIVALRPANEWLAFDFAPGDLLTHVNGVSVEHYSTWFEQFEALPNATQIQVDLVRDGKPKTVVVKIAARSAGSAPVTSTKSESPRPAQVPVPKATGDAQNGR